LAGVNLLVSAKKEKTRQSTPSYIVFFGARGLPVTTRAIFLLALVLSACPGFAEVCEFSDSTFSSVDGRVSEMKLPGDSTITIIEEESLNEGTRAGAASLFTERPSSVEELADRVGLFLSGNQDEFNIANNNLTFLQGRLQSRRPPSFLAVDMPPHKLDYLRKMAKILSLHRYVQVNELGAKNEHWDELLLIAVGPVVYLRTREPELFHATTVMAMDDQAPTPFHQALNGQEQKIPEWMEKLVGRGGVKEAGDPIVGGLGKLPEGDGVFVLSNGSLPAVSSALMSECEKLRIPQNSEPIPAKTEQGNNVRTPTEEIADAEEGLRRKSRSDGWGRRTENFKATKETDPDVARKNAMARHALAYSWVTIDGAGHRWVHIRPIHYEQKE
jgi:hypothetical protein